MNINRFITESRVATGCFILGGGVFTLLYGRESLGIKYYVKYIQKYKGQEPVPVHSFAKYRFESVLDDLNVSKYNREYYDLFITKELDPIRVGAISVRQGVKIGLPEYYQAATANGVKTANSTIHGTQINWSSEDGERLLKTFALSEDAQKFAIAKEIKMADSQYMLLHAVFPIVFILAYSAMTHHVLNWKKMHLRSGLFTLSVHIVCGVLLAAMYVFCENALYLQYDKVTFEDTLNLSHAYMLGGIEYYEKMVERNKILRKIVKKGEKYYDEDGDLESVWTATGIPYSIKVLLAKELLQQDEVNKEAMTPPPVNPNPHPVI